MKVAAVVLAVAVAATLLPVAAMPAPIEENPLFEKVADPVSGVVSYALKYGAPDDNRQSLYFTAKSMTDDGRYLVFWYTKGNETKGIEGERLTMVADLETGKVLPIAPLVEMGTPFVDTKENYLVYGSPEADGFWKVPFADPTHPVKLCGRPKALEAFGRPVHYYSHLTLTPDRKKAFLDAALESADGILFQPTDGALTPEDDSTRKRYVQGLLALETGDFDFWGETPFCCNHGQLNPVRGDLAMAAWERCWEGEGKKFQKESGVYPRMWFVEKGKRTLVALPRRKIATHELWDDDGTGHIWCGGGIWHRDLATGEIDCWLDGKVSHAAHATASPDKKYVVFDHQADPKAWWRGCGWSVTFLNRETGQMVDVFSVRPPLVPKDRPSQLHPDPHPHFVMNARYVVSTACNADGHMDLYVTPVAQLVAMTSAGGSDANDPEAALAARLPDVFTRAAEHYKALDAAAVRDGADGSGGKAVRLPYSFALARRELCSSAPTAWTAGFYPGSLWFLYEATGDGFFKDRATFWTEALEANKSYGKTHDIGFKIMCSFGNARRILGTDRYDGILLAAAQTLSTRFCEPLGLVRSWGGKDDKKEFMALAEKIKAAFAAKYVKDGIVANGTQSAQATGLYLGLVPAEQVAAAERQLVKAIEEKGYGPTTGIFSTRYMLMYLSEHGRVDVARKIVLHKGFPGWLHMLERGATTLWETWKESDDVYSNCHPMFGSVDEWILRFWGE